MAKMPSRPEAVSALLPLKPLDYHILLVLLDGECHGYRMVKEIERQTGGQIRPEAGNLYRSIRRLLDRGLITESGRRPAPESDDERRRYYRIADFGASVFAAETARMRAAVEMAEARAAVRCNEVTS
jgi:DNA-binding PadR family transcriptional regulator